MTDTAPSWEQVLAAVPQREPFRFIDEILELDREHVVARYTWRPESDFYRGHFPGQPVTPGVLLVEAMAQAGIVALGIYIVSCTEGIEAVEKLVTLFTDANIEFAGVVKPGDRVTTTANVVFYRRRKLRCEVEMKLDDGTVVCSGTISGMGVPR